MKLGNRPHWQNGFLEDSVANASFSVREINFAATGKTASGRSNNL